MANYEPTNWSCGEIITAERMNNIERGVADIMSEYVPTEWQCGDTITAEKLNKIEQGIANADCGGGSSITYATVTATYTFPEDLESAEGMYISGAQLYGVTDAFNLAITWNYEDGSMPISELGTPSQMSIPIYNPYSTEISQISYEVPGEGSLQIDVDNTNVVSGDAMKYLGGIFVYGDCTLDITLVWP